MAKPGVMFYFDVRPCLKRLTDQEKGVLFEAILDYGQYGVVPDFDGMMGVAWDFIQPRIEADDNHYKEIVQARKDAAKARWKKSAMQMHADDTSADCTMQMMPNTTQNHLQPNSTAKAKTAWGGLEGSETSPISEDQKREAILKFQEHFTSK